MFDNLSALGYGLVTFAIIIGIGTVILSNLSESMASCISGFNYTDVTGLCQNNTNASDTMNPSTSTQNLFYLNTQLGTNGLAGWVPAIIALSIGMLFLGVFLTKRTRKV